jgi:hypothetical protein
LLTYGVPERNLLVFDTRNGYIQFSLLVFYPTKNIKMEIGDFSTYSKPEKVESCR